MSDIAAPLSSVDPRDRVLLGQCPMLMAPFHGALDECEVGARRLIAAQDGIWLECRTEAFHFCGRVTATPLPYGPITGFCRLTGGLLPASIKAAVIDAAIEACPVEMACLVVWSRTERAYRLLWPDVATASGCHVTYSAWQDTDDNVLAVDIHSHGNGPARFSGTDDVSDRGIVEPHLSVVIGNCHPGKIEMATRLCVGPFLVDLPASPFAP